MATIKDSFSPIPEDAMLWRYLDMTKLLAMLESKSLYFCRTDLLGDPFEGSMPRRMTQERSMFPETEELINEWARKNAFINCWHLNSGESAAMWGLYLKSGEGVAIQTTFKKLNSIVLHGTDPLGTDELFRRRAVRRVKYINYELDVWNSDEVFASLVHKRKSYSHENEVRCIVVDQNLFFSAATMMEVAKDHHSLKVMLDEATKAYPSGVSIPCDPKQLIERIFVSPTASNWFQDLIRSILNNRYNLSEVPVLKSGLLSEAIF